MDRHRPLVVTREKRRCVGWRVFLGLWEREGSLHPPGGAAQCALQQNTAPSGRHPVCFLTLEFIL